MSDIFDEVEDLKNTKSIVHALHKKYDEIAYSETELDIDERRRCTALSMHWPGDDVVRQIIYDTLKLLSENSITPRSVKWQ